MRQETWRLVFTDGSHKLVWCKRSEILDQMTARQFLNLSHVEIINRAADKTKHKPITREQIGATYAQ